MVSGIGMPLTVPVVTFNESLSDPSMVIVTVPRLLIFSHLLVPRSKTPIALLSCKVTKALPCEMVTYSGSIAPAS